MVKLCSNDVQIIEDKESYIHLYFHKINKSILKEYKKMNINTREFIDDYDSENNIIFCKELGNKIIYLVVENKKLYIVYEEEFSDIYGESDIVIKNVSKKVFFTRNGMFRLAVNIDGEVKKIDDFISDQHINFNESFDIKEKHKSRFRVLSYAKFDRYHLFLTYDYQKKEYSVFKVKFEIVKNNDKIDIKVRNKNDVVISNLITSESSIINLKQVKSFVKVFSEESLSNFEGESILSIFRINKKKYILYTNKQGLFLRRANIEKIVAPNIKLQPIKIFNKIYLYGYMYHYGRGCLGKYEYLYLRDINNNISKFIRPLKFLRFFKKYGYFKIDYNDLNNGLIHNNLLIGDRDVIVHNLYFNKNDRSKKKVKTYTSKVRGENIYILRTNLSGNITSTVIPYSKEYTFFNKFKIKLAEITSKIYKNKENLNLYFEKKASKADESSIRVFEEVKKRQVSSKNKFIIDKNSEAYKDLKIKYGNDIIKKYSFNHYLSIFMADNFISSELSNHVLNDRLFIDNLRNKIMSVPLVFLQHGIMFAKPVDNPMAFGFHKDKNQYNIYKSVISSELEAGEFYKMKYDRNDLILTGLATFDYAKLDENADKIAYMPTYRYWEEGLIYNNNIEQTTFYKSIIKMIKTFENAGLLDKLLIVPHNKFSEYIYNNMPEYKHILSNNPSEALKISKVFITDYSSAIYDAQFRGAYPIFYWEEKDYLISQYKAIPPINENNAPAPIAYNLYELVNIIKNAIDNNFELEDKYKRKYLKINEFSDRKNTKRIVDFLQNEKII
ncbi:CDP-glycerol glycerophosphotransferase family protein [Clostridium tertium]|uniref:CDP-glycerol glycerophosphotransferase family protein n=1 Tax=Clostridium tertium TaxID=1559 RepID=UPI0034A1488D